jgi:DNA-binding FadR family transcriptional regulator
VERGLLETRRGRGGGSFVCDQWPDSSTETVGRTLSHRLVELRDRCDAICRLQGAVCRAAAESRTDDDVAILWERFGDYRSADSGLPAQQADSRLHLAINDAAHNDVLTGVLLNLKATVSIGAPAHLWGEPSTMAAMEKRALHEHEQLVRAIEDRRADDADALARHHGAIDYQPDHRRDATRRRGRRLTLALDENRSVPVFVGHGSDVAHHVLDGEILLEGVVTHVLAESGGAHPTVRHLADDRGCGR